MTIPAVFITGVSSGIGNGLAKHYLAKGWRVYGASRRKPDDLAKHPELVFAGLDLFDLEAIKHVIQQLLHNQKYLELVILNAGQYGRFGDMRAQSLDDILKLFDLNVWANKVILDEVFSDDRQVSQVVAMSSGASLNGNRGWGGYSLSKAALNMLIRLYSRENPNTHFAAFAPGLVETPMLDYLLSLPPDPQYPSLEVVRNKRGTTEMPTADEAAPFLAEAIASLPELVESGTYCDVRELPRRE
jgi:NAD(P)-dependent dehydrogenase (short-subunit alcohol dehydrogenase family)